MSLKEIGLIKKMRVPYLTKCCRRYPLKSGCKIAGWYSTVASILGVINGFHDLAGVTSYNEYPEVAVDLIKLKIIFCLLDTAFSVVLLMGLYLERTNYLLSWLVAKSILLLCEVPLYILMSYFDKLCDELGVFLFFMGIDIYCVLVVHGYFMEITNVSESEV